MDIDRFSSRPFQPRLAPGWLPQGYVALTDGPQASSVSRYSFRVGDETREGPARSVVPVMVSVFGPEDAVSGATPDATKLVKITVYDFAALPPSARATFLELYRLPTGDLERGPVSAVREGKVVRFDGRTVVEITGKFAGTQNLVAVADSMRAPTS